jgi:hypothetical protein
LWALRTIERVERIERRRRPRATSTSGRFADRRRLPVHGAAGLLGVRGLAQHRRGAGQLDLGPIVIATEGVLGLRAELEGKELVAQTAVGVLLGFLIVAPRVLLH